jgi:hypothetical protein
METPLVILLTIALVDRVETAAAAEARAPGASRRDLAVLAAVMVLSLLARADGFVLVLIALLYLLLRRAKRAFLLCGGVTAAAFALHVGCRLAYYGHPLPNTFYAKVSGPLLERLAFGWELTRGFALQGGLLPYLIAFLVVAVGAIGDGARRGLTAGVAACGFASFFAIFWLGYFHLIGGDLFGDRFLVILWPIGILVLLERTLAMASVPATAFALALTLALQLGTIQNDGRFRYAASKYDRWVTLGEYLAAHFPGRTLATDAAGKTPYYSGLPSLDMLGLTDEHIAHEGTSFFAAGRYKSDPAYVLARKPDLIATWVDANFDTRVGITRAMYAAAGYRIRLLVSQWKPEPGARDVVDVQGLDPTAVRGLILSRVDYAVLERARM